MNTLSNDLMPWNDRGGLMRIRDAARVANLSEYQFEGGCRRGDIPLALVKVGRLSFVRAAELAAWLNPCAPAGAPLSFLAPRREEDLFAGAPQ